MLMGKVFFLRFPEVWPVLDALSNSKELQVVRNWKIDREEHGISGHLSYERSFLLRIQNGLATVQVMQVLPPEWLDQAIGVWFIAMFVTPLLTDYSIVAWIAVYLLCFPMLAIAIAMRAPRVVHTAQQKLCMDDRSTLPAQCLAFLKEGLRETATLPVPSTKR